MKTVRILIGVVAGVVAASIVFGGTLAAGFAVTMGNDFHVPSSATVPTVSKTRLSELRAAPSEGKIPVAVVLGTAGTVATDVMGPFNVFGASDRFAVYTVSVNRKPVALSGGLSVIPDATIADLDAGRMPRPQIIVVPALSDPEAKAEAPLRKLIESVHHDGTILGVCAGARVLAATNVLDGRSATSFWSDLPTLRSTHPETTWIGGKRWVDDGNVITTAGVSSGIAGALHLVDRFAGHAAAEKISARLDYPGWTDGADQSIPVKTVSIADASYVLGATLPWFQPTYGLMLKDGVGEIDVAAPAELWGGAAFLAHVVPIAEKSTVVTEHGMTLVATPLHGSSVGQEGRTYDTILVPGADKAAGESAFDPVLRSIAQFAGKHVAETAAKYIEYPVGSLPAGGFATRLVVLIGTLTLLSIAVGVVAGRLTTAAIRRRTSRLPANNSADDSEMTTSHL